MVDGLVISTASQSTVGILSTVGIDQLRCERLSREYHYPPFWWSKLLVVRSAKQCANSVHNAQS